MSFFKAPKMPPPIYIPPPPPPPSAPEAQVDKTEEARKEARARMQRARGLASTIQTSGMGLMSKPQIGIKTAMGE